MEQLLACFSQAVDALKAQSSRAPSAKLTLVVHDWGCIPGFMYSNTAGCDKLVAFDVLLAKKPDRLYYALKHLTYQGHFAICFKVFPDTPFGSGFRGASPGSRAPPTVLRASWS